MINICNNANTDEIKQEKLKYKLAYITVCFNTIGWGLWDDAA